MCVQCYTRVWAHKYLHALTCGFFTETSSPGPGHGVQPSRQVRPGKGCGSSDLASSGAGLEQTRVMAREAGHGVAELGEALGFGGLASWESCPSGLAHEA